MSQTQSGAMHQRSTTGQVYSFTLTFRKMLKSEAFPILSFFESQVGNTITLTHPQHLTPLGAGGSGVIKGASQTGSSITTDGWANSTLVLKAGDIISVGSNGSKVYRIITDVTSDGSGNATLNIFPPLIASPADNATVNSAGVLFNTVLKNNVQKHTTDNDNIYTYKISLIETT